ncbi:MAG: DUF2851 family protein, partial [Tannerella sp.]|nr:DUF2851 family protein [Tannerella sp.]
MEQLLHYVWKYRLYATNHLTTTDGEPVEVIDPGIHNTDAGPDFFNAKVRIGGTVWAGSIEIHERSSDWWRHGHDKDKAYDSVVLHLVSLSDACICRSNGEAIPEALLPVPEQVRRNIGWLLQREASIPCLFQLRYLEPS